jgi:hypothetical protein
MKRMKIKDLRRNARKMLFLKRIRFQKTSPWLTKKVRLEKINKKVWQINQNLRIL